MEAKIYIEEMERDVTFSCDIIEIKKSSPSITIDNIKWENELYSIRENDIIEKYFENAVEKLFENINENINQAKSNEISNLC